MKISEIRELTKLTLFDLKSVKYSTTIVKTNDTQHNTSELNRSNNLTLIIHFVTTSRFFRHNQQTFNKSKIRQLTPVNTEHLSRIPEQHNRQYTLSRRPIKPVSYTHLDVYKRQVLIQYIYHIYGKSL